MFRPFLQNVRQANREEKIKSDKNISLLFLMILLFFGLAIVTKKKLLRAPAAIQSVARQIPRYSSRPQPDEIKVRNKEAKIFSLRQPISASSLNNQVNQVAVQEPKNEEYEFYKSRAGDFLRQVAGLSSSQINAINQQNENIRLEFKSISITNRQNLTSANQLRQEASDRHYKWMIHHLGEEIYYEFLKIDD